MLIIKFFSSRKEAVEVREALYNATFNGFKLEKYTLSIEKSTQNPKRFELGYIDTCDVHAPRAFRIQDWVEGYIQGKRTGRKNQNLKSK